MPYKVFDWSLRWQAETTLVITAVTGLVQGIVNLLLECVTRPTVVLGLRAYALLQEKS